MSALDDHVNPPLAVRRLQEKVPYITAWSGEAFVSPHLVWRDRGIGYADERPGDRDEFGVLWRRGTSSPGKGRPRYGVVHHGRQRRAMGGLLCQVCARPTRPEATEDGVLFVLGRREAAPWPAPIVTTRPPLCLRCATDSVALGDHVAVRCRAPRLYGVSGIVHVRAGVRPIRAGGDPVRDVPYASPYRNLVQAGQSLVRLDRYTLVHLESEASALAA